jgi:hypothetical protein
MAPYKSKQRVVTVVKSRMHALILATPLRVLIGLRTIHQSPTALHQSIYLVWSQTQWPVQIFTWNTPFTIVVACWIWFIFKISEWRNPDVIFVYRYVYISRCVNVNWISSKTNVNHYCFTDFAYLNALRTFSLKLLLSDLLSDLLYKSVPAGLKPRMIPRFWYHLSFETELFSQFIFCIN